MKKFFTMLASFALIATCVTPTTYAEETTENTTAVAEIDGVSYNTLSEAFTAANDGQTVKLLSDMKLASNIDLNDKELVLDLNGKNITQDLVESVAKTNAPIRLYNSTLTVNDSVGTGSIDGYQCAIAVFVDSTLTLNSGTLKGSWYGIAGNGLNQNGTNIVINGGNVSNSDPDGTGAAIYHPQTGTITINGGTIKGDLGIQLCSGTLSVMNINGGTIEGTGQDLRANKKGAGAIPDGAAVSVVNRSGYNSVPKVNITGGTFVSANSEGLLAYAWKDNKVADWVDVKDYVKVAGGTFDSDPSTYVAAGYKAFASNGDFTVAPIATSVVLDKTDLVLAKDEKATLNATLNPNETLETITWKSSDDKVATVVNGEVTAVAPGKATITVTTESGKTAQCNVVVSKPVEVETPDIDTSKPVDKVEVGIKDEKVEEVFKNTVDEIISGTEGFTDKKTAEAVKEAVNDGKDVSVVAEVKKADTSNAEVKKDAEKVKVELEKIAEKNNTAADVAMYLDLSVQLKADKTVLGTVNKLSKAVTFTVMVPENLKAEGRIFYVIRVHDGKAEKLETKVDGNALTFETDRFSTYALVYEDKKVEPTPTPTPTPNPEPEKETYKVVFVDMNGAALRVEEVVKNGSATAPEAPVVAGYRFVKWDSDFTNVTKDLTVKAIYEKVENAKADPNNPNTGDTTNTGLFASLALLSLVAMGYAAVKHNKKAQAK